MLAEKVTGVFADGFVLAIHTIAGVLVLDCNRRSGCTRDDIGQLVPAKKDIENEALYDSDIAWVAMAAKEGRLKSKNNLRVPEDPRSYPTPVLMDCYVAFRLEVEAERREGART